jgi:hypothetical protein
MGEPTPGHRIVQWDGDQPYDEAPPPKSEWTGIVVSRVTKTQIRISMAVPVRHDGRDGGSVQCSTPTLNGYRATTLFFKLWLDDGKMMTRNTCGSR